MQIHIAFGANLGDREENIHQAVQLMSQQVGPLIRCSSLIETAPVDMLSDNAFLNAVAIFDTKLAPGRILQIAKRIERQLGRDTKAMEENISIVLSTLICCNMGVTTSTIEI